LRQAILDNPQRIMAALPDLEADRPFLESLLEESGHLLGFLPPQLRDDRRLVEAAVRGSPSAIQFASQRLRADKELGLMAVKGDGYSIVFLSPELRGDVEVGLAAVRCSPWVLQYLPPLLRAHAGIVREASLGCYDSLEAADPSLWRNLSLMRELALAHPLTLEVLEAAPEGTTCLEELLQLEPQLDMARRVLRGRLARAGITVPGRLGKLATLEQVLANREREDAVDGRPLAVLVTGRTDHNKGLYHERVDALMRGYRVLFYEVANDEELIRAVKEATAAQKAELLIVHGHGAREAINLGGPTDGKGDDPLFLNLADQEKIDGADLKSALLPGGHVVLGSCNTGEGKDAQVNMANMLSASLPHVHIYAPIDETNSWTQLDDQGRFKAPGFLSGKAFIYQLDP